MTSPQPAYRWIPSAYIMQGLPYALVSAVSPVFYKTLGISNHMIALYTSLFTLPWVLKFIFSPFLESFPSKKKTAILMQYAMAFFTLLLAISTTIANVYLSGIIFLFIALCSAIHDISIDGLYLENLSLSTQAKYIGIRSLFYQFGKFICQTGLLYVIGLFSFYFSNPSLWSLAYIGLSFCILLLAFYNQSNMPAILASQSNQPGFFQIYKQVLKGWQQIPHVGRVLLFILLYNFPDIQLMKILPLFLLDDAQQGGLHLSMSQVSLVYGGMSLISLLIGISLSGFFIQSFSLKKCLMPFTFLTMLGNTSYLFLNQLSHILLWQISACVIISQFCFGLCNGAYMFYLVHLFSRKPFAMSLYASATTLMLLSNLLAGSTAGYLQWWLGYPHFFIWIVIATIGILALNQSIIKCISDN